MYFTILWSLFQVVPSSETIRMNKPFKQFTRCLLAQVALLNLYSWLLSVKIYKTRKRTHPLAPNITTNLRLVFGFLNYSTILITIENVWQLCASHILYWRSWLSIAQPDTNTPINISRCETAQPKQLNWRPYWAVANSASKFQRWTAWNQADNYCCYLLHLNAYKKVRMA